MPLLPHLQYHPSYHPSLYQFPHFPLPFTQTSPPLPPPVSAKKKERKKYTCRKCGNSEGHGQYKGQRFCPKTEKENSYEEWLKNKRDNDPKKK